MGSNIVVILKDWIEEGWVAVLSMLGLIIVWQASAMAINDTLILPSFLQVLKALTEAWHAMLSQDLPTSLFHFGMGMAAGLLVALPLGMIMGWSRFADRLLDPLVEVIRPIPPLAWIPFAIIWFGLTQQAAGFIVFTGAVFPVLINTYMGFRSLPRVYVESAMVLGGARDLDLIRYVAFPYALPSIAGGVRIAMGIAWMVLVAAEMFGVSTSGLGYKIWYNYSLHRMDYVLLYMISLGVIGLLMDRTFRYLVEDKLLRWRVGLTQ